MPRPAIAQNVGTRVGSQTRYSGDIPSHVVTIRDARKAHELFQAHSAEALDVLVEIMNNPDADHGHRITAAKEVLARAYGQAPSFSVVQGLVEHQHQHSFNAQALESMTPEQLEHLESTLASIVEVPEAEEVDPEDGNES